MGTRENLVGAATALFVEAGPTAVSVRAITERVGITPGAMYKHFASVDEVLAAVYHAGVDRFTEFMQWGEQGATPRDRLFRTGEGFLAFATEHREYYRVFLQTDPASAPAEHRADLGKRRRHAFELLQRCVDDCIKSGDLDRSLGAEHAARILFNWANGISTAYLARIGPSTADAFRRHYRLELAALLTMMHPTREAYSPVHERFHHSRDQGGAHRSA